MRFRNDTGSDVILPGHGRLVAAGDVIDLDLPDGASPPPLTPIPSNPRKKNDPTPPTDTAPAADPEPTEG